MTRRGWALFIAVGVIWGLPYLLIRVSMREVTPAFLVFVRTGGGALLLAPFVVRRGALTPLLSRWKPLVALALVELAVPWWFLFDAEKKITSSLAGLLVAAVPIAGAVIARVTGTDRLDRRRAAGLGLGVAGVAALVGFDVGRSDMWAASSLLVVVVGYALGPWILARYLSDLPGPSVITAALALCAIVYAPLALLQRPQHALSAPVLASMAGLTVVCTAVAFVAFFALIAEVGAMRSTVVTYLNPAVAVLLGVTVLGEPFGVATGVGFVLVLAGSFLATRSLDHAATASAANPARKGEVGGGPPVPAGLAEPAGPPGAAPAPSPPASAGVALSAASAGSAASADPVAAAAVSAGSAGSAPPAGAAGSTSSGSAPSVSSPGAPGQVMPAVMPAPLNARSTTRPWGT
jgi:drug/metabolite transporter (DMT)-like permease